MSITEQPNPPHRAFVDRPDLTETFADSIHSMVWDGATMRIEFCVTRYPAPTSGTHLAAPHYPVARMVLTPAAASDLFNRLQQTMRALADSGAIATAPANQAP